MPIETPYQVQPMKDRLLNLDEVMKVTDLSRSSVFRRPELRQMRIKVGFRTLWSEVAVQEWLTRIRKPAESK
jgi:predicted DNA-binding transcriptional regulator AlpA